MGECGVDTLVYLARKDTAVVEAVRDTDVDAEAGTGSGDDDEGYDNMEESALRDIGRELGCAMLKNPVARLCQVVLQA